MGDALATRAKIGVLVPASNTIVEPELAAMAPAGVTNHTSRMAPANRPTHDMAAYAKMMGAEVGITEAIDMVVPSDPDIIVLGHSIDTFVGGTDGAIAMKTRLTEHAGREVVIPSLAITHALEVLGRPKTISILTPYMPPADEVVQAFFESAGYAVHAIRGLQHMTPLDIASATPDLLRDSLDLINAPEVEVLVKVGTNSSMSRLVVEFEQRFNKPIVTVNVAMYWHALRRLGFDDRLTGYGILAENF